MARPKVSKRITNYGNDVKVKAVRLTKGVNFCHCCVPPEIPLLHTACHSVEILVRS